ncbi:CopG family transcriptional regulator [Legionella sainthelensi]|uniref:CopG family transcriptional regulator n=1 Tax=Legionella sainthelensi TaxID=28087 RepID=UPI000E205617|nr:CopG family transcriptional regulator [Legionella sainthelensi]VEB37834.1 CopG family transcriptional regulator [Legionella sainthelensi]
MESKTARFTVLMDPRKKQAFERLCASQDLTPSQVVRQLIREYLEKYEVHYLGEDTDTTDHPQEKN